MAVKMKDLPGSSCSTSTSGSPIGARSSSLTAVRKYVGTEALTNSSRTTSWPTCASMMGLGALPGRKDRKSTRLNSQSHSDLVCRLLLEKKKKQYKKYSNTCCVPT